jgi:hypothetical protein
MKCQACKQDMIIIGNKIASDEGTTEVYSQMEFGCRNPKCVEYTGTDLKNPKKSIKGDRVLIS